MKTWQQKRRVSRPAGLAPRLVGAPVEPETAPNPVQMLNPTKSAAALRAERYRARQRQLNPDFEEQENKRKQTERSGKLVKRDTKAQDEKKRAEMLDELLKSGHFPTRIALLRKKVGLGLFMTDAPKGEGKIITGGVGLGDEGVYAVHNSLRIDNLENTAPLRARLTEEELRTKLLSHDTESRIAILNALIDDEIQEQLPQHIYELLPDNIDNFSIDEINQLFEKVFETVSWFRDLIDFTHPDGPQFANSSDPSNPIQEARCALGPIDGGYTYHGDKSPYEDNITQKEIIIPYLPRGPQEKAMIKFIENTVSGNTIPKCANCGEQLAPDFYDMDQLHERQFRHLQTKHPDAFQKMREAIERAGKRTRKCRRAWVHAEVLQQLLGDGTKKIKCQCGKVLYDPEKPKKKGVRTRSESENEKAA